MRQCVVCGCFDVSGKERRSGYKCGSCVGKSSKPEFRYLSGKLDDFRELFLGTGYGNGQPVTWITKSGISQCGIVDGSKDKDFPGWWEGSESVIVLHASPDDINKRTESTVNVKDLYPLLSSSVVFPDEKRTGYKVKFEAVNGVLKHSIVIKGTESKSRVVSNLTYSGEPPTIYDPELGITSRAWLPTSTNGYLSAPCVAWRLAQLAAACGVNHNIPSTAPNGR
eukprot:TRINITY_DN7743_c0_g1_i1.p1 TRINITY_DN7743_c0_g1~~TRINITY_DN7743_c0_g1_i1.p1  ORF type:complete len:224 (+),score=31.26 TRINITY_DN7743_c0_g1_i1:91-762(+)